MALVQPRYLHEDVRAAATYEGFSEEMGVDNSSLAYAGGNLYLVDYYKDPDDGDAPSHMRIRRFSNDYSTLGEGFLLKHDYARNGFYDPPMVTSTDSSIYIGTTTNTNRQSEPLDRVLGLERVDVATDGRLTCSDLSAALSGITNEIAWSSLCIATSEEGVFLICSSLDALLPAGAGRTDTFFLANDMSPSGLSTQASSYAGATDIILLGSAENTLEPYTRTLSYAPFTQPIAVCADGWLYAYAVSNYEDMPVFGRATEISEPEPEPEPQPVVPQPQPSQPSNPKRQNLPSTARMSTASTLPRTGDMLVEKAPVMALLALAGLACIMLGRRLRRAF